MQSTSPNKKGKRLAMPSTERVQEELAQAKSMDDFFGKEGIFARLFADTLEQMLEAELSEHLGYKPYEARGRNSGNNRNGHYPKKVRTSGGETVEKSYFANGKNAGRALSRCEDINAYWLLMAESRRCGL